MGKKKQLTPIQLVRKTLKDRVDWESGSDVFDTRDAEHCCGVIEIGDFSSAWDHFEEWLKETDSGEYWDLFQDYRRVTRIRLMAYAFELALRKTCRRNKAAFFFATTACPTPKSKYLQQTHQHAAAMALRGCGFKPFDERMNPNSSNKITFWVRKG